MGCGASVEQSSLTPSAAPIALPRAVAAVEKLRPVEVTPLTSSPPQPHSDEFNAADSQSDADQQRISRWWPPASTRSASSVSISLPDTWNSESKETHTVQLASIFDVALLDSISTSLIRFALIEQTVRALTNRDSPHPTCIVMKGDAGSGKSVLAQQIVWHVESRRAFSKIIQIDCRSLPVLPRSSNAAPIDSFESISEACNTNDSDGIHLRAMILRWILHIHRLIDPNQSDQLDFQRCLDFMQNLTQERVCIVLDNCSDPHFVAVLRVLKITTLALTRAADLGLTDSPKPLWKLSPTVQIRIAGVGGDVRRMCELIGNFVSIPALPRLASTSMKSVLLDIASAVGNSPQAIRAISRSIIPNASTKEAVENPLPWSEFLTTLESTMPDRSADMIDSFVSSFHFDIQASSIVAAQALLVVIRKLSVKLPAEINLRMLKFWFPCLSAWQMAQNEPVSVLLLRSCWQSWTASVKQAMDWSQAEADIQLLSEYSLVDVVDINSDKCVSLSVASVIAFKQLSDPFTGAPHQLLHQLYRSSLFVVSQCAVIAASTGRPEDYQDAVSYCRSLVSSDLSIAEERDAVCMNLKTLAGMMQFNHIELTRRLILFSLSLMGIDSHVSGRLSEMRPKQLSVLADFAPILFNSDAAQLVHTSCKPCNVSHLVSNLHCHWMEFCFAFSIQSYESQLQVVIELKSIPSGSVAVHFESAMQLLSLLLADIDQLQHYYEVPNSGDEDSLDIWVSTASVDSIRCIGRAFQLRFVALLCSILMTANSTSSSTVSAQETEMRSSMHDNALQSFNQCTIFSSLAPQNDEQMVENSLLCVQLLLLDGLEVDEQVSLIIAQIRRCLECPIVSGSESHNLRLRTLCFETIAQSVAQLPHLLHFPREAIRHSAPNQARDTIFAVVLNHFGNYTADSRSLTGDEECSRFVCVMLFLARVFGYTDHSASEMSATVINRLRVMLACYRLEAALINSLPLSFDLKAVAGQVESSVWVPKLISCIGTGWGEAYADQLIFEYSRVADVDHETLNSWVWLAICFNSTGLAAEIVRVPRLRQELVDCCSSPRRSIVDDALEWSSVEVARVWLDAINPSSVAIVKKAELQPQEMCPVLPLTIDRMVASLRSSSLRALMSRYRRIGDEFRCIPLLFCEGHSFSEVSALKEIDVLLHLGVSPTLYIELLPGSVGKAFEMFRSGQSADDASVCDVDAISLHVPTSTQQVGWSVASSTLKMVFQFPFSTVQKLNWVLNSELLRVDPSHSRLVFDSMFVQNHTQSLSFEELLRYLRINLISHVESEWCVLESMPGATVSPVMWLSLTGQLPKLLTLLRELSDMSGPAFSFQQWLQAMADELLNMLENPSWAGRFGQHIVDSLTAVMKFSNLNSGLIRARISKLAVIE